MSALSALALGANSGRDDVALSRSLQRVRFRVVALAASDVALMKRLVCLFVGHSWGWNRNDLAVVLYDLPTATCARCAAELPNVLEGR